jgi:hypothetical protein
MMTDTPRKPSNADIAAVYRTNKRLGRPTEPYPYKWRNAPHAMSPGLRADGKPANWDFLSNADKMTWRHMQERDAAKREGRYPD